MARTPSRSAVEDALYQAQELVFQAWDARTAKRRIALATKALQISPLCADAYGILAEHSPPGSEAELEFRTAGEKAGREALGRDFKRLEGEFWGFMETRPYMRLRFGLACALWHRGEAGQAVDHLQAMLRLNPNDNQGVRYILVNWLAELGRDDELAALLEQYREDDMAQWRWTAALAAFRRDGAGAASQQALSEAMASNAHVAALLCGTKAMPKRQPLYYSPGEASEAQVYVEEAKPAWNKTPGALDWVRTHGAPAAGPARRAPSKPGTPRRH
jgi:tetratricopeptide (TPR) repeat protein